MSRRIINFASSLQTFVDIEACLKVAKSHSSHTADDRPSKRRKLDEGSEGWASIHEFNLNFSFNDDAHSAPDHSTIQQEHFAPVLFVFEDPVISIFSTVGEQLFAYVCQDAEADVLDRIAWIQRLATKDATLRQCIQTPAYVCIQLSSRRICHAKLRLVVEVRFDQHLPPLSKLSLKDRLALLDYAFDKPSIDVTSYEFYSNIGKLPKDFLDSETEKTIQHPLITCRLFPFQKRAVAWMLQRERERESIGHLSNTQSSVAGDDLPHLWETVHDNNGKVLYLNRHQGYVTSDEKWVSATFGKQIIKGGILAEVAKPPFN